jgi:hypothetical protein
MDYNSKLPSGKGLMQIAIGIVRVSLYLLVGLFMIIHGVDYLKPVWNYTIGALIVIYGLYRTFRLLRSNKE